MGFLIQIVNILFTALTVFIFARIIFSFVRVSPYHPTWGPIMNFVFQATEPLLAPIRNILPPMGGLDFSPMLLLIGINFLQGIIVRTLSGF